MPLRWIGTTSNTQEEDLLSGALDELDGMTGTASESKPRSLSSYTEEFPPEWLAVIEQDMAAQVCTLSRPVSGTTNP